MKEKVIKYIKDSTKNLEFDVLIEELNSPNIAKKFHIKRNTVSQYLNESTGRELVKINTRPVIFLHKEAFETRFFPLSKYIYSSVQELLEEEKGEAHRCSEENVFHKLVGYNGSLKKPIEQITSSIFYPDNSLPVLIYGPTGSGKSYLAQLAYEFCINNKVLSKEAPFNIFNCAQYANNPELLSSNLFGHVKGAFTGANSDAIGILEASDGGMLFLDEVHRLNPENQEKLFTFIDKGIFRRVGENDKWHKANIRLIMATTEDINSSFLETFIRRIPIVVTLPSLEERGYDEKLSLIQMFFYKESKVINKNLVISGRVIDTLVYNGIKGNVGGLYSVIKYTCARAYSREKDKREVYINLRDLPDEIINSPEVIFSRVKRNSNLLINPNKDPLQDLNLQKEEGIELRVFFEEINVCYKKYTSGKIDSKLLEYFSFKAIKKVAEYFIYSYNVSCEGNFYNYIFTYVAKVLDDISLLYNIKFTRNNLDFMAKYFYTRDSAFFKRKGKLKDEIVLIYQKKYPEEFIVANKILSFLCDDIEITIINEDKVLLTIFLASLKLKTEFGNIKPIIVAYGSQTAESISDTANILLNHNIFEGINVPVGSSIDDITKKLIKYINDNYIKKGLLIMVDMIPLKELYMKLQKAISIPFAIINNASTNMAVKVGKDLMYKYDMEEIVKRIKDDNKIQYYIKYTEVKDKALLAICPTGVGTANKLKDVLKKSIPEEIPVKIIDYQYESLANNDKLEIILNQYEVIGIIGTSNPNIKDIPFASLHDIISENLGESINEIFKNIATTSQIETIINRLVVNLSLERLIGNITILDKTKLLNEISDFIKEYEEISGFKLDNRVRYNIYFHVSCLIERLIRNAPIDTCENLEDFIKNNSEDIKIIKNAFSGIEEAYSVDIPVAEIKYLYHLILEN